MADIKSRELKACEYANNVLFPFLIKARVHVNKIKKRLAAGEKLTDIHADMEARGEKL